jgi:acyl-CoA reductase-like NAD-dependent aldehyde dehydrogenase
MDDNPQQPAATRRKFLAAAGGFAGSIAAGPTVILRPAAATPASMAAAIRDVKAR